MSAGQNRTIGEAGPLWEFTDKPVTAWGGMVPLAQLLERSGVRDDIRRTPWPRGNSHRAVDPAETFQAFLVTLRTGGFRFAHTAHLRGDVALREMFALKSVPAPCTFTRRFNRFGPGDVDLCMDGMIRRIWQKVHPLTLTLDLDSTVFTRHGDRQEGAERGYNPAKRGRKSHHPLIAFAADVRMLANVWLRPGAAGAANNATAFLDHTPHMFGGRHKVGLLRCDSGFCTEHFIGHAESLELNYTIATPFRPNFRHRVGGITGWVNVAPGIDVAETTLRLNRNSPERRVILVRQHSRLKPDAQGKRLFEEEPDYRYGAYINNLTLPPVEVWRLYRGRADSENRIKELKHDFGADRLNLKSFWATEAALKGVIIAYNLLAMLRQIHPQHERGQTVGTRRAHCFAIGAVLGRQGRHRVLRLGLGRERRPWFEGLWSKLHEVDPWKIEKLASERDD